MFYEIERSHVKVKEWQSEIEYDKEGKSFAQGCHMNEERRGYHV